MITAILFSKCGEGVPPLRREAIVASPFRHAMRLGRGVQGQDALATKNKGRMPSPRIHGQARLPDTIVRRAKEGRFPGLLCQGSLRRIAETA
ncbi:MAG: hypothetical protein A2Y77_14585 [Planctomycetes bacterium RBG_13_62_9]|nr:MAG: hypothetical protein A2Y77_14585 [Planctomycetes bacterium RBG_13_62_9]